MKRRPEEGKTLAILRSAVENTNEAFVTIDDRQKVLFFNKAAEKILGYSRSSWHPTVAQIIKRRSIAT